jgi:hypothetical protein
LVFNKLEIKKNTPPAPAGSPLGKNCEYGTNSLFLCFHQKTTMKKLAFALFATLILPLAGYSQFVKIFHKESNTEFTGSSFVFFFNAPDGEQIWSGKIKNISGASSNIRVARTQISRLAGSTDYYCWNVCLDSTVSNSGSITLDNNQTDSTSFHAMYRCGGASGVSVVNYRFFDAANPSDSASVTLHYISTPTSVEELDSQKGLISSIGPVPADESLQIGYNLGTSGNSGVIEVFDLSGKRLLQQNVSGNTLTTLNLSGLESGFYSVRMIAADGRTDTRKILIR